MPYRKEKLQCYEQSAQSIFPTILQKNIYTSSLSDNNSRRKEIDSLNAWRQILLLFHEIADSMTPSLSRAIPLLTFDTRAKKYAVSPDRNFSGKDLWPAFYRRFTHPSRTILFIYFIDRMHDIRTLTAKNYHFNWCKLNCLYSEISLADNLLKPDGGKINHLL